MNKDLGPLLLEHARSGMIKWSELENLSVQTGIPTNRWENLAISLGIIPLHYLRNLVSISDTEQQILLRSKVAVIGCGGLGGHVVEQLARLGVGTIVGWDYDTFEEHNLNRQLLSSMDLIGHKKVESAAIRIAAINPAVRFQAIDEKFDLDRGKQFLTDCQVVVDALDSIPVRLELAETCGDLQIPLVHGAVEGWYGQITTQFPGDGVIEQIYAREIISDSPQEPISTLAFTPAMVASLQAAETIKILLGRGELLRKKLLLINLLDMDMDVIEISGGESTIFPPAGEAQNK